MITPSFALNFVAASLDPRVTFTRVGATATQVNSSGYIESVAADTPRFDYDPVTLACRGLLIEDQKDNLVLRSQEFNVAAPPWIYTTLSVTANDANGPDNLATADKLTATGTFPRISQAITLADNTSYTMSVFVAKGSAYVFSIVATNKAGSATQAVFNIDTGVVVSGTGKIEPYKNGFFRCQITFNSGSGGTTPDLRFLNHAQVTGGWAGTTFLYAWGAQLEVGTDATSYIPTTASAVTRNADVATITGTNFSDFWQASKGGVLVQAIPSTVSGIRPLVQYDDGTADNIIALRGNAANPELQIVDGGAPQVQLDAGTIVANTPYSLTGWWQTNDCKARQNSGATVSDDTATIPTVTQARLGSDGTNYLNGHLATINYYDRFSSQIYTRRKNKVFSSLL